LFLEKDRSTTEPAKIPEWSQERIQELTYSYEDDWYYIERMDGAIPLQRRNYSAA